MNPITTFKKLVKEFEAHYPMSKVDAGVKNARLEFKSGLILLFSMNEEDNITVKIDSMCLPLTATMSAELDKIKATHD